MNTRWARLPHSVTLSCMIAFCHTLRQVLCRSEVQGEPAAEDVWTHAVQLVVHDMFCGRLRGVVCFLLVWGTRVSMVVTTGPLSLRGCRSDLIILNLGQRINSLTRMPSAWDGLLKILGGLSTAELPRQSWCVCRLECQAHLLSGCTAACWCFQGMFG